MTIDKAYKYLPSFARRGARSARAKKDTDILEKLLIGEDFNLSELFINKINELWLEIGFGNGEHLIHQARNNPNINIIGGEVYESGLARASREIDIHNLTNIRLFSEDIRLLLEQLPDESISRIFILFPDPWPKSRHHKRRLITPDTLEMLHQVLKPNGLLRIATDHIDYAKWIAVQLANDLKNWQLLAKTPSQMLIDPDDHLTTKYQRIALDAGRDSVFYDLVKN